MTIDTPPAAGASRSAGPVTPGPQPRLATVCPRLVVSLARWLAAYVARHRPAVRTARQLVDLLTPLMVDRPQEQTRLVLLDRAWQILDIPLVYRGNADFLFTDQVIVAGHQLGIEVVDHIIISQTGWYSPREHGDCDFLSIVDGRPMARLTAG